MTIRAYTHPSVLEGIAGGAHWADPIMNPEEIDWAPRQALAAIPFQVADGRPVNPCAKTGIERGRNEFGHWGEALMADALVTLTLDGCPVPFLLLVERADGHGWAVPGGHVEPGETGLQAAIRELAEETGLDASRGALYTGMPPRYVPDPRASDEAWAVTVPVHFDLGLLCGLPAVMGGDDALRAAWIPAGSLTAVEAAIRSFDPLNGVFAAHVPMLAEFLGS
jgi:ADP-ribose pyrophosphatase